MEKKFITIGFILISLTVIQSCKKDKADTDADNALFSEIQAAGFSYYQNGNTLSGVSPSPHGAFKLRFNAVALAALDSTGELPAGSSFPQGSLIVKELFSGNTITLFSIMKKDPSNENAGNGWVWAELKPDGSASFSTSKKGNACISCHSGLPNRDLIRTFDLH